MAYEAAIATSATSPASWTDARDRQDDLLTLLHLAAGFYVHNIFYVLYSVEKYQQKCVSIGFFCFDVYSKGKNTF
jgi:hypothetical protein